MLVIRTAWCHSAVRLHWPARYCDMLTLWMTAIHYAVQMIRTTLPLSWAHAARIRPTRCFHTSPHEVWEKAQFQHEVWAPHVRRECVKWTVCACAMPIAAPPQGQDVSTTCCSIRVVIQSPIDCSLISKFEKQPTSPRPCSVHSSREIPVLIKHTARRDGVGHLPIEMESAQRRDTASHSGSQNLSSPKPLYPLLSSPSFLLLCY